MSVVYAEVPAGVQDPDAWIAEQERIDALLANVRTGSWLAAQTFPDVNWAVPGVIPEGLSVLVGAPKVGKSWLILGLCLATVAGSRALGCLPVQPRRTLYLALEDSDRRMKARIHCLEPEPRGLDLFHYETRAESHLVTRMIRAFLHRHPDTQLIVIDTLAKVRPAPMPGESAYAADYRVVSALKSIADDYPGLALVVVHHDRKAASADFVDAVSGTNGIAGAADTVCILSRDRHASTALLQVTGRDVEEGEYALTRVGESWTLEGNSLAAAQEAAHAARAEITLSRQGDRIRDVVALVQSRPTGTTPRDVTATLGIDPRESAKLLGRAVERNLIDKPSRGLYTPLLGGGVTGVSGNFADEYTSYTTYTTPHPGVGDE